MRKFKALLKKDFTLELESNESLLVLGLFVLVFSLVLSHAVSSAFLTPIQVKKIFPGLFWANFIIVTSVTLERTYYSEYSDKALEAVSLLRVSGSIVFLSKVVRTLAILIIGYVINIVVMCILLGISLIPYFFQIFSIGLGVSLGIASLATLISGITIRSRIVGVLFPVVTVPLLLPVYFASSEMTAALLLNQALDANLFFESILMILSADILYLCVGMLYFERMIRG